MDKGVKRDLISAGLSLAFGIAALVFSTSINAKEIAGDPGSAFLPRLVGGLTILLSLILLAQTLPKLRRPVNAKESGEARSKAGNIAILLSAANLLLYVLLLRGVGFILSSILFLILQMCIMSPAKPGKRELIVWAVISLAAPIIIYVVFVNLFSMPLPLGILKF